MLTLSIVRHPTRVHCYVSRWAGVSRYPERVLDVELPPATDVPGRDLLRHALRAVLAELEGRDGQATLDAATD